MLLYFSLLYYTDDKVFLILNIIGRLVAGSAASMLSVASMSLLLKATPFQTGTIAVRV